MVRDLGGVMEERFMTCVEYTMDGGSVDTFGLRMVWKYGGWLVTGIGGGFCGVCAARKGMYFEDPYFESGLAALCGTKSSSICVFCMKSPENQKRG